jgi:hypothetical protein
MVTTRERATQNSQQIIRDVFNLGANSSLEKALTENDLMDITDWMLLMVSDLDSLTYNDNGTQKHLGRGPRNRIRDFRMYVLHERAYGSPATYDGGDIVFDKFDSFRRSNECIRLIMAPQPVVPALSAPNVVMTSTQSELATFKKGIKRNAALYPVLTQDTEWDSWNHSVVSLARAQSAEQVLDNKYVPSLPDEIALFSEKNKYHFSVFDRTLQSEKGKAIVRAYEDTFDAQKVYKEMYNYCNRSTRAQLTSSTLLSYITSAHLGDGSWKSGTNKFILHWEEQVRKYEKLVKKRDNFWEAIKLHMLQNVVHAVPELWQVKVQADQLATQTGRQLSYVEYVTLLYSAAVQYDSQFTVSVGAKLAQKWQVYAHEFDYDFVEDEYDVDTPVSFIQANKMMRREAMMPGHTWAKLSEADQEIWDQLSDHVKIAILNAQSQLRSRPPTKPPPRHPDKLLVSLHDVIQACQHLTLDPREDSPDVDAMDSDTVAEEGSQGDNTPPSADLLTFTTNHQSTDHIPPAHLAKLMSDAINKHSSKSSTKRSVNVL